MLLFWIYKKHDGFVSKPSCLFGGAEGNRTPVRRQLDKTFSGRSLLFTFPHPIGNKHSMGLSSLMMHGTLKALRTHGLHSNHTRARLVDLPGRMRRLIRQPVQQICCQLNLKGYPFYCGQAPQPAIPASLPPSKPVRPHIESKMLDDATFHDPISIGSWKVVN